MSRGKRNTAQAMDIVRANTQLMRYADILMERLGALTHDGIGGAGAKIWLDGNVDGDPSSGTFEVKTRRLSKTEIVNTLMLLGLKEVERVLVGKEGHYNSRYGAAHKGLGMEEELLKLAGAQQDAHNTTLEEVRYHDYA